LLRHTRLPVRYRSYKYEKENPSNACGPHCVHPISAIISPKRDKCYAPYGALRRKFAASSALSPSIIFTHIREVYHLLSKPNFFRGGTASAASPTLLIELKRVVFQHRVVCHSRSRCFARGGGTFAAHRFQRYARQSKQTQHYVQFRQEHVFRKCGEEC
jgi:hypothetical protein